MGDSHLLYAIKKMTQETRDYIETWTKKVSSYKDDDLATLFDKYTALYTLYNRLYNESYKQMKIINQLTKNRTLISKKQQNLLLNLTQQRKLLIN